MKFLFLLVGVLLLGCVGSQDSVEIVSSGDCVEECPEVVECPFVSRNCDWNTAPYCVTDLECFDDAWVCYDE